MTKLLLLSLSLLFLTGHLKPVTSLKAPPAATVYVCVSNSSVAYHNDKNCRGLNRCTHKIVSVSEEKAGNDYHKRKCQICY